MTCVVQRIDLKLSKTSDRIIPVVTVLDLGLPPSSNDCEEGFAALSELLAIDQSAKVIVISGKSEETNALRAVGVGAYDFSCVSR
jgi:two-component system NtrC family response regulator